MCSWETTRLGQRVDALIIQGKRLASAPIAGSELAARTAVAAWLYHSRLADHLVCVEGDINRPHHPAGSLVAAELLRREYGVPPEAIIARAWADCTRVEVRAIRVLTRHHGWRRLAALTSTYHARRVRDLYAQVGLDVAVVVCDGACLEPLVPFADPRFYAERVAPALRASRLSPVRLAEEHCKEALLLTLTHLDRRGVLERWLARRLRHSPQRLLPDRALPTLRGSSPR